VIYRGVVYNLYKITVLDIYTNGTENLRSLSNPAQRIIGQLVNNVRILKAKPYHAAKASAVVIFD
jgi:hypothetical protein